jgi:ABC-2 type transport system permease protein
MVTTDQSALRDRAQHARYVCRVIYSVTALNVRAALAYRSAFITAVLLGLLWQTATLTFAAVLVTRFHGLGGFSASGVLLIIGVRLLSHAIYVLCFDTLTQLPVLIDESRVDSYFLRPLSIFVQILLSNVNINALGDLSVGIVVFSIAVRIVHVAWTLGLVVYLILAVVSGILLEAAIQLALSSLLVRSPASRMIGPWVDELMSTFGSYPLSILPNIVQYLFTWVLPLAFFAYFPVEVILGIAPRSGAMAVIVHFSPCAGPVAFYLAWRIFAWSLRGYRSVGG